MADLPTVVEQPEFLRRAKAIMSDEDRSALVDCIAASPEAGISSGGGLRKVRIAREGSGKSGGYRTVHVFAKNEKDNLTKAEQSELNALSKALLARYGDQT